nr:MAG TPA: hypothetical protein [Caudoviricetes sp.]
MLNCVSVFFFMLFFLHAKNTFPFMKREDKNAHSLLTFVRRRYLCWKTGFRLD